MSFSPNKKRRRTIISQEQIDMLENAFRHDSWPNKVKKTALAELLDKSEHFVSVWFQNRRAKWRKEEREKLQLHYDFKPPSQEDKSPQFLMEVDDLGTWQDSRSASQSSASSGDSSSESPVPMPEYAAKSDSDNVDKGSFDKYVQKRLNVKYTPVIVGDEKPTMQPKTVARIFLSKKQTANLLEKKIQNEPFPNLRSDNSQKPIGATPVTTPIIIKYDSVKSNATTGVVTKATSTAVKSADNQSMRYVQTSTGKLIAVTTKPTLTLVQSIKKPQKPSTAGTACTLTLGTHVVPVSSQSAPATPVVRVTRTVIPPTICCSGSSNNVRGSLFHTIMNMLCVAEGGIITQDHPEFSTAANDLLYGIRINDNSRIVYEKYTGLDLVPLSK